MICSTTATTTKKKKKTGLASIWFFLWPTSFFFSNLWMNDYSSLDGKFAIPNECFIPTKRWISSRSSSRTKKGKKKKDLHWFSSSRDTHLLLVLERREKEVVSSLKWCATYFLLYRFTKPNSFQKEGGFKREVALGCCGCFDGSVCACVCVFWSSILKSDVALYTTIDLKQRNFTFQQPKLETLVVDNWKEK